MIPDRQFSYPYLTDLYPKKIHYTVIFAKLTYNKQDLEFKSTLKIELPVQLN
jgi:hypothetical protein